MMVGRSKVVAVSTGCAIAVDHAFNIQKYLFSQHIRSQTSYDTVTCNLMAHFAGCSM